MRSNVLLDKDVLRFFPKVELHRHIEGSFPLKILYDIAKKNGIEVPASFEEFRADNQFPKDHGPDFLLFLSKFRNHWYRSHQDVYDIAYHSVLGFKDEGLFYLELRFNPDHFAAQNNFDHRDMTQLVIKASQKAAKEIGLRIKFLITFNRGKLNPEEMIRLYHHIKDASDDIVGIDLAGDETNYPPEWFSGFFEEVKKDGRYLATVHAGEVTPPTQIWEAINSLHAKRIGHGTSAILDEHLQDYLIQNRICLEQCLISNYQTGSCTDIANHPFKTLFRRGVPVTLNSDDPTIQDADLNDDYLVALKHFDFTLEDLIRANLTSLECSFRSPQAKARLKKDYLEAVAAFRKRFKL